MSHPAAICGLISVLLFVIFLVYMFSGGDDKPQTPPVTRINMCQQKEDKFQKDILVANYIINYRLNDNYTDIDVIAQNNVFRGHRVILAAHSQVFESKIFMKSEVSDYKNASKNQIEIDFVDYKTLSIVLNYIYTTQLPDQIFDNVMEFSNLMKASDELQMDTLKCEISKRLSKRVDLKRSGIIVAMAEETDTRFLMTTAAKYLLDNFNAIKQTTEWQDVIKNHKNVLTNAIDFVGKLPDNGYCEIICIPETITSSAIFTRLRHYFFAQRFTDAEISVLSTNVIGNDRTFKVNRAILIGQSAVFRQQFANTTTPNRIVVNATTSDVMEEFLAYMYSGWPTEKMKQMAEGLLYLSTSYEMHPLQTACEDILYVNLKVLNAVRTIIIADRANSKRLFSFVLDFILKNRKEVVATKDWAELKEKHPEILTKIFSN